MAAFSAKAQTLDYESIVNSKPLKVGGVISANGVFYDSNQRTSRLPFTYYLQGTLNVSVYSFSMPITYSYSNQGDNFGYQLPFNFNRISLHPKYKWATGHMGMVTMSFSPYTLNGHQFTGGGIDLNPPNGISFSAMGGRLLNATNDDLDPRTIPAYERKGYGMKVGVEREKYKLGAILFYAKDDMMSIDSIPEAKGVLPQENVVLSANGKVKITPQFSFDGEFAQSILTKDLRAKRIDGDYMFIKGNSSTEQFSAYNFGLNYNLKRMTVGLGYEYIAPGYETLGAYFFNNDFENITVNAANSFFKDKLTLSFNIGYQKDNLKSQKTNSTNRTVGSFNANFYVNERLNLTGSYSNFTTFTNTQLNQFDIINDSDLTDQELQDLDYKQLSQNANLALNYTVGSSDKVRKAINANYALNTSSSEQGGVSTNDESHFHNINTSYTMDYVDRNLSIIPSLNATYAVIANMGSTTWGPIISLGKKYFNKTLQTRYSIAYSRSKSGIATTGITNLRASLQYVLRKRHNFSLSAIQMFRNNSNKTPVSEFTATVSYSYAFGVKKPKIDLTQTKREKSDTIVVSYKKYYYEGVPLDILPKLLQIRKNGSFQYLTQQKKTELKSIEEQMIVSSQKDKKQFKKVAQDYLKSISDYEGFDKQYDVLLFAAYTKLVYEAEEIDGRLEKEHLDLHAKINSSENPHPKDLQHVKVVDKKYYAHKKLLAALKSWKLDLAKVEQAEGEFGIIKDKYKLRAFEMFESGTVESEIIEYLEIRIADYYHKVMKKRE